MTLELKKTTRALPGVAEPAFFFKGRLPGNVTSLDNIDHLSPKERQSLRPVTDRFSFRSNEYYLSLVDWQDPEDPIRRIIIPHPSEIEDWSENLDPSREEDFTVAPGLQHKYKRTALFLINDVCGGFCRFCFRKRIFTQDDSIMRDVSLGLDYIKEHPEITNVLLTGGDPLVLSTGKLRRVVAGLRAIDHVRIIRIGTKMPAFNPFRIINDPLLVELIRTCSLPDRRIYVICHFNHPRELTPAACRALDVLQRSGAMLANQTPILRGVNDNPRTMAELFKKLSFAGVAPYYVFICRPVSGNRSFFVPVEEAHDIFQQALMDCSGLAKRARLVMSHASGKIEVLGRTGENVIFRRFRSPEQENVGEIMLCRSNPEAYWFDDYPETLESFVLDNPFSNCV